ncbi:MAG: hypothetical protein JRL30_14010 [Deltaproteobacteria bacterium]|nr:hypothetical protein [Deltaproteobacteria bacterium]
MDQIDEILRRYERDLKRAKEGKCKKVSRCIEFRSVFRNKYNEVYKPILEDVVKKLTSSGHSAKIEENSPKEPFFRFALVLVPRHFYEPSIDRYYPNSLWSSISFAANEHTLSVDIERVVRPTIEGEEKVSIVKVPNDMFDEQQLMEAVVEFLQTVFDETIVLDFSGASNGSTHEC